MKKPKKPKVITQKDTLAKIRKKNPPPTKIFVNRRNKLNDDASNQDLRDFC